MRATWLFLLLALAAAAGPASAAEPGRLRVRGGTQVRVTAQGAPDLSVAFVRVVSDERCPATVQCVWANPPVVTLAVSTVSAREQVTLGQGGPTPPGEIAIEGWRIAFDDLEPSPQVPEEFSKLKPLTSYTLVLTVTRR